MMIVASLNLLNTLVVNCIRSHIVGAKAVDGCVVRDVSRGRLLSQQGVLPAPFKRRIYRSAPRLLSPN